VPSAMAPWAEVPDVSWVVEEPHPLFAARQLCTYGMCGYWDMSPPCLREDGSSSWLQPGVQHTFVDIEGDRRLAMLKDTARVVMPHAQHSRLDDPTTRDVTISLELTPLQTVKVHPLSRASGDISLRNLLALLTPLQASDVELSGRIDARRQQSYRNRVTAHRSNSVFFHRHAAGPPPCLLLVLCVQWGPYPSRRSADFSQDTVAAILLDEGGVGPGLVFCHTDLLSDAALEFVGQAFVSSAVYRSFCEAHHKEAQVRIVDSETEELGPLPTAGPGLSDEDFKQAVLHIEARERRERETERERWRLRLREIVGWTGLPRALI